MKQHSVRFKTELTQLGKQLDSQIIYNNEIIDSEQINSINPSFEGNLLKSVMKSLEIDSNIEIPVGAILRLKTGVLVDNDYEYLDFGNYVVKEVEKQEDSNSYLIKCYDKMLYSMTNYKKIDIPFPCKIRDYIDKLCNSIGLIFKNANDTFVNWNKTIPFELYLDTKGQDIGYKIRDVFDELAEVTASTICLDINDNVEIRYINDTNDIIDEEYLKDVNVNFGKKYGPLNSVVLSRAGGSDNIYLSNEESVNLNGLCEIKITDNQIMNFNNRDEFLPEILNKLNGLEYYLNDYSSTGILYYDLLDRYNVLVGNNTYSCVMLNDSINISQGLEENVHTDMPEKAETDYSKADKTDRKINQTYIIVDKQNQKIESVVSQTAEQNQKISKVEQTVDELNSKISDIADITISKDSNIGVLEFEKINISEPIRIVIRPLIENISYLYPNSKLFPSNKLFPKVRTLRFTNITKKTHIDFELPKNLLYYDKDNFDEFILDYNSQTCVVNKRIGYNADGTTYILPKETTYTCEYPKIQLEDGNYKIELLGYDTAYIFARLMTQNIYTDQFATRAEVNSQIKQTTQDIDISVNKKLESYSTTTEMNSAINLSSESITSSVSKTYATKDSLTDTNNNLNKTNNNLANTNQKLETAESKITQNSENINTKVSKGNVVSEINQSAERIKIKSEKIDINGTISANGNFKVTKDGNMECNNGTFNGNINLANGRRIIGGDGMLSNLQFFSVGEYFGFSLLGFNADFFTDVMEIRNADVAIDVYIPDDLIVESAILTLQTTPAYWEGYDERLGADYRNWGNSKQLKIYKGSQNFKFNLGYMSDWNASLNSFGLTEIPNAFGENSYTPSDTSGSSMQVKNSVDIKNYITKGNFKIIIRSALGIPPNLTEASKKSGVAKASLNVFGYKKIIR